MRLQFLVYVCILFILLNSCEENYIVPSDNQNTNLLFPFANTATVTTTAGVANFPIFDISAIPSDYIQIGVFSEAIQVENGEIKNQAAMVWHWNSGEERINTVSFDDGTAEAGLTLEDAFCDSGDFYWAVWAWDEAGLVVQYSTPVESFTLQETMTPTLALVNYTLVSEGNNDGYLQRNENITYQLRIKNTGVSTATNVKITVDNQAITDFPIEVNFGDIPVGAEQVKTVSFSVPSTGTNKNQIIQVNMTSNTCLTFYDEFTISLVKRPCVNKIYVDVIPYILIWDLENLSQPDVFYDLHEGNTIISTSVMQEDVLTSSLPVWWFYQTCQELRLDKAHFLDVWDQDDFNPDDLMARMNFDITAFVEAETPTIQLVAGNGLTARIDLLWVD